MTGEATAVDGRIDHRQLRDCLGRFATGVTVVTCQGPDGPHGFTANSFTSVSLDPPLVLVSVRRQAKANEALAGSRFAVHVLAAGDEERAWHFAGRPREGLDVGWIDPQADPPRLAGCLATLECAPWQAYDGGDHVLYLGRVERIDLAPGDPLLFFRGGFHQLGETTG